MRLEEKWPLVVTFFQIWNIKPCIYVYGFEMSSRRGGIYECDI
jgi:hypothetical protein